MKYRKKPVVIEARQFTSENRDELAEWIIDGTTPLGVMVGWSSAAPGSGDHMLIETLEGTVRAEVGDWIIRGVQGGFTQAHYDTLSGPWRRVIGPIHPDDEPVEEVEE